MILRTLNVRDLNQFDLDFGAPIRAKAADIGRSLGSSSIGLMVQTVQPGCQSSRRHRHIFQEEILVVMEGNGTLLHGDGRIPVKPGDCVCYLAGDTEAHSFENTGQGDLVIWAFGNQDFLTRSVYIQIMALPSSKSLVPRFLWTKLFRANGQRSAAGVNNHNRPHSVLDLPDQHGRPRRPGCARRF